MNKQQLEDLERTIELKKIVWGKVAYNLLTKKDDPYEIRSEAIESHRGRIDKAVRLLSDNVRFIGEKEVQESWGKTHAPIYRVNNLEYSKEFQKEPTFITTLAETHDALFEYYTTFQYAIDTVIYRDVSSLTDEETIYVYWHQDEFNIVHGKDDSREYTRLYPVALLDLRMKLIMRSLVEQYFHTNFHSRVETYLNLPEGSIKKEDHYSPEIRNFAAHGHRFTLEQYFGTNGFLEEYTHFRDYFQALLNSLNHFREVIETAGGHAAVVEHYRKDIITHLKRNAPLCAFQKISDPESRFHIHHNKDIEEMYHNPFLNVFILRNAAYLDYDTLYKEDVSILFINDKNECTARVGTAPLIDTAFKPQQGELDLIKGFTV